jgi:hypothetical protein
VPAPKGNKNAIGNKGGRPRAFENTKTLEGKIADYLKKCDKGGKLPTKGGLAIFLGITTETLLDYEKNKVEFSFAIKRAYGLIEETWTQRLNDPKQVTGPIFYLKNAFHWRDRTETDITSGGDKIEFGWEK